MNDDRSILAAWRRYAANADGFLGHALRKQRDAAHQTTAQQRTLLGILGEQYDELWLHLQAFPLPRPAHFSEDLARIVARAQHQAGTPATVDLHRLEDLIRAGPAEPHPEEHGP